MVAGSRKTRLLVYMVRIRQDVYFRLTHHALDPSTAQVLGSAANCDVRDIQLAIESANVAQKGYYSSTTAAKRGSLLQKWHDMVLEQAEDRK